MKKMMRALLSNKKVVGLFFSSYLIVIFYFLFLSDYFGRKESFLSYRYNFVPFREITRYIRRFDSFGFLLVSMNLAGNILAFIPFGIFSPVFLKNRSKWLKSIFLGLLFIIIIEFIQVVTRVGCYDVDDIILNMLGIIIGFFIHLYIMKDKKSLKT